MSHPQYIVVVTLSRVSGDWA